jgi:hypothetical protein
MSHEFCRGFLNLSLLVMVAALAACASPTAVGTTQPSISDQAATIVAGTMQALPTNTPVSTSAPEMSANLLPRTLYFLGNDGFSYLTQVYRIERDGKTKTQLTFEPNGVDGYDVLPVDGTLAFVADNQLILVNADGSNRRALVEGDPARQENDPRSFKDPISNPVFSPDGQTIAYAQRGLNLYDLATGISKRVLEDQRSEMGFPIEIYSPVRYSPDGTKLLVAMGRWEAPPAHAVYEPATNALVRIANVPDGMGCCSDNGGPVWSPDSTSFYGVASALQTCCQNGELWKVDAGSGAITGSLVPFFEGDGTVVLPVEVFPAPDGQLYFFYGTYHRDSGFFAPRVLSIVRSAADGVTNRTVLRDENFIMMSEALWAPDASLVIAAMAPSRVWDQEGGVLELYFTDRQQPAVWLAPFGRQLKWGP